MVIIQSNGAKWAGERPDPIETLFERLAQHPLDPDFEEYGNFISPARHAKRGLDESGNPAWVNGDPIYPDSPNALRFWGNFFKLSAVFSVDTDEPELIERLTAAIRANQATPAYLAAKEQRK